MADVTADDRAQIMLITALVIAVVFVALALVVNSAIYTENLSTRDSGAESREVLEQRATSDLDVERAIDTANAKHRNTSDVSVIQTEIGEIFHSQMDTIYLENARFGKIVDLDLLSTTEGAHLQQADENRNFTAGGTNAGEPDWTLAENATADGTFRFGVRQAGLLNASSDSVSHMLSDTDEMILGGLLFHEAFHVEITNESGHTWRTYMYQAPSIEDNTVYLYTEGPGEDIRTVNKTLSTLTTESCTAPTENNTANIDFSTAEVGGEPCDELTYYSQEIVGENHTISYRNARTNGLNNSEIDSLAGEINNSNSDMYDALENSLAESLLGFVLGDDVADGLKDVRDDADFTGGDRGTGTYAILVNTQAEEENFDEMGGDDPTRRVVVFSADVGMTYRTGGAALDTTEVEVRWDGADS